MGVRFPSPANFKRMETNIEKIIFNGINRANALIFYSDNKGKLLMCNKQLEETLGISKDRIVGKECLEALFPETSTKEKIFKAMLEDAIKYKSPGNFKGNITNSHGNKLAVHWSITPILSPNKEVEGVLFIGSDTTIAKERENSFKNMEETLKNALLGIKEYALYVMNLEGNITYYGMGSEDFFGWKKDEVIFKPITFLHSYDDISRKLPFILEEVKKIGRYELETYFIKKNGQSFPVNLTITKFIDADKNTKGYIFVAKDITERRRLEYQVFQSEKLAAVGQLVAGIAHEINNPVFVISGRAKMVLSRKSLSPKIQNDLKIVYAQAEKIRKLIDRFLSFTRKATPVTTEINLNKLIKETLPLLKYHRLPFRSVKVVKDFAKRLPKIKGDIHQLQEVFVNLFINAYQAMPEGGMLTVKTERFSEDSAKITIADTGSGILPESLKNLFMPFFSTKKEGTGLGLSICYNIISNHGGTIEVDSEPLKGTTFILKLPFLKKGGDSNV